MKVGSDKGVLTNVSVTTVQLGATTRNTSLVNGNGGSTSNISNAVDNSNLSANSLNSSSSVTVNGQSGIAINDIEFPKLFMF